MFRGFREVRTNERLLEEDRKRAREEWKKIKPETSMSVEECFAYIDEIFKVEAGV